MCVQYCGGAEYHGGYLEYHGGVQYCGGYHDKCGGISSVPWGCSVLWGDIMSTVRGYLEYCGGCSVLWGDLRVWYKAHIEQTYLWKLRLFGVIAGRLINFSDSSHSCNLSF